MDIGPQDHGWCAGYTCQRRLSLFHSVVALGKSYEVYFTGTSPQNLRLMLLNVDHDKVSQDRNNFLFYYWFQVYSKVIDSVVHIHVSI